MGVPRHYHTQALILARRPLREADLLITFLTPTRGKLVAVARGVRWPKSKLRSHLEPPSFAQLHLVQGHTWDVITGAEVQEAFFSLAQEPALLGEAIYAVELADRFLPEGMENPDAFRLLLACLRLLAQGWGGEVLLRSYELHLLEATGFKPELFRCPVCRNPLPAGANYFSLGKGGIVCPSCRELADSPLSSGAQKALRFLQSRDINSALRLRLPPPLAREAAEVLRRYIAYILEGEVKAVAFLDKLQREELTSSAPRRRL